MTTARSELGRELVWRDLAFAVPPADADALAERLVYLAAHRDVIDGVATACRAYARQAHAYEATASRLVEWCSAPVRAADRGEPPIVVGLVSEPRTMVRLLEAYVAELSVGQLAYRSVRWLWRRGLRRFPGRSRRVYRTVGRSVEPQRTHQ